MASQYLGLSRLLLVSEHSKFIQTDRYEPHGALLTPDAATLLTDGGLKLLGTDRLSVDDSAGKAYQIHHALLGAGCVILEGLALAAAGPGRYFLYAAPLLLSGTEASPVRALLRQST